jgi:hypothetical protein
MTSDKLGPVDIDLLADYIGGALDGPREAEVARLIDEDPRWRETYDLLVPGMAAVGAELTALGAAPEPMPADLADRLAASFASPTTIDPALTEPAEPHLEASPARHLSSVPGTGVDRPARKRKRLRWAAPIAVAAGVLAFAGFGADYLAGQSGGSEDAASTAGGSAENAAPMVARDSGATTGLVAEPGDEQIISSGTDYGSAQLSQAAGARGTAPNTTDESAAPRGAAEYDPAELRRLRVRAALLACLEAISRENGQGPIEVQTVDYARFQGAPAVVVRFVSNGMTLAWAVGPDCGAAGGGADRL